MSYVDSELIIKQIIELKNISENNDWIVDIVILIAFHQSMRNAKKFMNNPILDNEIVLKYFSKRLLFLMKILMINDSVAHSLFSTETFAQEINDNMDELINKNE